MDSGWRLHERRSQWGPFPWSHAVYFETHRGRLFPQAITALCFSLNGEYLASAGDDGNVMIWSTISRTVLFQYVSPCPSQPQFWDVNISTARHKAASKELICQITFSPTDNLLAWTDVEGVVSRWPSPIPSTHPPPAKTGSAKAQAAHKELDKLFADVDIDEDLGAADQDALDKMAVDAEVGDGYDDGWIIDDDEAPGGSTSYRPKLPAALDHDGLGVREMGASVILQDWSINFSNFARSSSQRDQGSTTIPVRFYTFREPETLPRYVYFLSLVS